MIFYDCFCHLCVWNLPKRLKTSLPHSPPGLLIEKKLFRPLEVVNIAAACVLN